MIKFLFFVVSFFFITLQGVCQTIIHEGRIFVLEVFPKNLQLYPRNSNDSAIIKISGKALLKRNDTIILRTYKNSELISSQFLSADRDNLSLPFSFYEKIHAELSLYKFSLYLNQNTEKLIFSVDSVSCGDFYVIMGQSNSHPTNDSARYENPFCRSFGTLTGNGNYDPYNPKDTLWGLSNGHGYGCRFCGEFMVGVWGLKLQELVCTNLKIPNCIINGGTGGSTIEENLKNLSEPDSLKSIYGKLLYRINKAGAVNKIKALFWYQGEANSDETWKDYRKNFDYLYSSWKKDIGKIEKIYLLQTRPGCDGDYQSQLREEQRKIAKKYADVELMTTTGIGFHDGCHYSMAGYNQIGEYAYRLMSADLYNSGFVYDYKPPNIIRVKHLNKDMKIIEINFDRSLIIFSDWELQKLKNYFYTIPFHQEPYNIIQLEETIFLFYNRPNYSSEISYLPNKYYNSSSNVYEGPFLRSRSGVGVPSFIENIGGVSVTDSAAAPFDNESIVCYPNPADNYCTIRFRKEKNSPIKIKINDIVGRAAKEFTYHFNPIGKCDISIPVNDLASGVYLISVDTDGKTGFGKIIIQR